MNHCMQAKSHVIYKIIRHTSKMPYVSRRGNYVHYNYINNYLSIFRPFYEIFSSSCKVGFRFTAKQYLLYIFEISGFVQNVVFLWSLRFVHVLSYFHSLLRRRRSADSIYSGMKPTFLKLRYMYYWFKVCFQWCSHYLKLTQNLLLCS